MKQRKQVQIHFNNAGKQNQKRLCYNRKWIDKGVHE